VGEARLLDRRRASAERQVGGEAVLVLRDPHAERAQRLDDLDRDRSDGRLAALGRCEARRAHDPLAAVLHDAEGGVHHPPVRVDAERGREEEVAGAGVPVEEIAVIEVAVAGRRLRDRLRGLVEEVIVETGQHGLILARSRRASTV
jgi:hypothetical protein